jgi:hypothetical protein
MTWRLFVEKARRLPLMSQLYPLFGGFFGLNDGSSR